MGGAGEKGMRVDVIEVPCFVLDFFHVYESFTCLYVCVLLAYRPGA